MEKVSMIARRSFEYNSNPLVPGSRFECPSNHGLVLSKTKLAFRVQDGTSQAPESTVESRVGAYSHRMLRASADGSVVKVRKQRRKSKRKNKGNEQACESSDETSA